MHNASSSAQAIVQRLLPTHNGDAADRGRAWNEWLLLGGSEPVLRFIRWTNSTHADDDEILQETLILAYVKVEKGAYQDRDVPFTAFLKKIAWYKIMEASRRYAGEVQLDEDVHEYLAEEHHDQEHVEYWKEREALRQAMAKLPPRRSPDHLVVRKRILYVRDCRAASHQRGTGTQREKSGAATTAR
ncbi:MAG: hypothetical protein HC828_22585, partial [Blastochloris sp.]|nr:hypothetical protein [Blastochloris sp.]